MEQETTTLTRTRVETPTDDTETPQNAKSELGEQISTPTETVPTPSEMVALGRPPYIVDILECRMAYETFDVAEQIAEIDEFIRSDIPDNNTAYENSVRGLLSKIKDTQDIYSKIEQLRDYVRIQQKIRNVIKEREEFEQKDPAEMTASQLKRYFKEHGKQ